MDYDKYFNDLQSQLDKQFDDARRSMEQQLGESLSVYAQDNTEATTNSDYKFCPECGARIDLEDKFCYMCGAMCDSKFSEDEEEDEYDDEYDDKEDDELCDNEAEEADDELPECPVDWENFEGCSFTYTYEADGEEWEVEVTYEMCEDADGEEMYCWCDREGPIDIYDDAFRGCEDINDCGVVIAKRVIHNNDGEVKMSFGKGDLTFTDQPCAIVLDKDLNYATECEETVKLTLYANQGCDVIQTTFYELDEEEFESVKELIEEGDTDSIWDYMGCDFFCNETFDLFGDESSERLGYEICDSDGEVIDEGDICVTSENVFRYRDVADNFAVSKENHPQYILVTTDNVKRSYAEFEMPAHFSIGGISLIDNDNADKRILHCDHFGEKVTGITQIRYAGRTWECDDMGDAGTLGNLSYFLYTWDDEEERYQLVAEA